MLVWLAIQFVILKTSPTLCIMCFKDVLVGRYPVLVFDFKNMLGTKLLLEGFVSEAVVEMSGYTSYSGSKGITKGS